MVLINIKFIGLPFQKILEELEIDSSKKDLVKNIIPKLLLKI